MKGKRKRNGKYSGLASSYRPRIKNKRDSFSAIFILVVAFKKVASKKKKPAKGKVVAPIVNKIS